MSSVSNVNPVRFNSNELMQKVVGRIHQINPPADKFSQACVAIADVLRIPDIFAIADAVRDFFVGFTKEGKAQKEARNGLQCLAIQINTGDMNGVEASVKAFSARVKSFDSSLTDLQVASLFQETMIALSTARRNPIKALTADKVEQVTKEVNSALGIKEAIKEATVTAPTSSFPYKKVAVAVAGLAVLGVAAYFGISALLASHASHGEFIGPKLPVCLANESSLVENEFCPAVLKEVVKNIFPTSEKVVYPNLKLCFLDDAPRK